jgi:hypothetical protein
VFTPRVLGMLRQRAHALAIGVDLVAERGRQHAELVAIYDLDAKKLVRWTGSSFAAPADGRALVCVGDLATHILTVAGERLVVLGAHDLEAWAPKPRAPKAMRARENPSGELRRSIARHQPTIVVQHAHTSDGALLYEKAWRALERKNPSVQAWAAGIAYFSRKGRPRETLENVLSATKYGTVFDVILES